MSVPDKNLTKHTLLVQRSPQALIHYHTMVYPHFTHQTKHAREKERERREGGERQTERDRERLSLVYMKLFLF